MVAMDEGIHCNPSEKQIRQQATAVKSLNQTAIEYGQHMRDKERQRERERERERATQRP